jgi:hypothetical protein
MAQNVTQTHPGIATVERNEKRYLGINTNIPAGSFSLRKLAAERRQPGLIVRNGETEKWLAYGFVEHGGSMYVYGDLQPARNIDDFLEAPLSEQLRFLSELAGAYAALGKDAPRFHTKAILRLDDGGFLFLPPEIREAIREHEGAEATMERFEPFNHPDQDPVDGAAFVFASLAYRAITGSVPFPGDTEEDLHARIRSRQLIEPRYKRLELRPEISTLLSSALTGASEPLPPQEWSRVLQEWADEGVDRELSAEERAQLSAAAQVAKRKVERTFARKESVRRNWRLAMIITAVVVVVGSIPGTIIYNALQPRQTAGFSPEEVVTAYYLAMNNLDHMIMEDAVVGNAGRDYIREVTNLFVISRQRMSVEFTTGFRDAQAWRDEGMPELTNSEVPYGVANLSLSAVSAPAEERAFEATYERWLPEYPDVDLEDAEQLEASAARYVGVSVTDRVLLRRDKEDWVIYQIERLSQEPIDLEELRASVGE